MEEFDYLTAVSIALIIPGLIIALVGADIIDAPYSPGALYGMLTSSVAVMTTLTGAMFVCVGMLGCSVGRRKDAVSDLALYGRVLAGATVAAWYTMLLKCVLELAYFWGKYGSDSEASMVGFIIFLFVLIIAAAVLKVTIVSGVVKNFI